MKDISMFDTLKDKPRQYNLMVTGYFRDEISQYYVGNQVPVVIVDGYPDHIKKIIELSPKNVIHDINEFKVHDVNTNEVVCFDFNEFLNGTQYLNGKSYCYKCDSCNEIMNFNFYHDKITLEHRTDKSCFKVQDYSVKFTVPENGKMAINDWLGDILSEPSEDISVNSQKGKFLTTKDAESKGFVHFYVGNTCPSVFKLHDGTIIIAPSYSLCTEESDYEEVDESKYPGAEKIGWVCTDLWWVTMASEDHCLELESKGNEYRTGDIIELESGEWECTVHIAGDDSDNGIYATMKKVK